MKTATALGITTRRAASYGRITASSDRGDSLPEARASVANYSLDSAVSVL